MNAVGIDNRAGTHLGPALLQVHIDPDKDRPAQNMLLQKMQEIAHRGFVRGTLHTQINPHKLLHRLAVLQGSTIQQLNNT